MSTALYRDNRLIANIGFGVEHLLGELVIEIGTVGNQYDSRAGKLQALHQSAGQKLHGEALATTGCAKVGATLAITLWLLVGEDIVVQLVGCIELWVAADNLFFLVGHIRKEDKIPQHLEQTTLIKQAINHGEQGVNAVFLDRLFPCHLAPGVEELVGGKQAAHLVIHAIADNTQGIENKQLGNIPPVAHGQLLVGMVDGGLILADCTFKLEHHQRQTVDIKDGIRDARLLLTFDLQLIDQFVDVVVLLTKVEELDIQVLGRAIFSFEVKTIRQLPTKFLVAVVQITGG